MKFPAEPKPEWITAVVDTREQTPWDLSPLQMVRGTLATGDYSIVGLEDSIAIERKSLPDMLGCMGKERDRFERELVRMRGYEVRAVIVETVWDTFDVGWWSNRITPKQATGSLIGWMAGGIPFIFCDGATKAQEMASRILFIAARRRWREARGFAGAIVDKPAEVSAE